MSKQTELVGLARTTKLDEVNDAYDAGALSNRNMVINGAMNVAQRSASVAAVATDGYYTLDRWHINMGTTSAGRLTMSQTADGPNNISANCLKLDCTTADTSIAAGEFILLSQKFEGQNLQRIGKGVVGAKQVTVSFYVKASASFTFGLELYDNDNSRQITKLFDTTTDWVRHEITFPADVDDGSSPLDDDNANSLQLQFWLNGGATYTGGTLNTASWANDTSANRAAGIDSFFSNTANNFFITGVQMEVGPVATEFEQEEISVTENKCFRYFQKFDSVGANYQRYGVGFNYSTTGHSNPIKLLTPMRAVPAVGTTGTAANYAINHNADAVTACNGVPTLAGAADNPKHSIGITCTVSSGLDAGDVGLLISNNNVSSFLSFDAEL